MTLAIEWAEATAPLNSLVPYERNPRKIGKDAFARLKTSIQENGYHQRIICTPTMRVIGGHMRIRALQELGITEVPVLMASRELTEEEYKRILIQDNVAFGIFDTDILASDFDFDDLIKWGIPEELMIGKRAGFDDNKADEVPTLDETKVISRPGDLWVCGKHRVMCGDSTARTDVDKLLQGIKPDLAYNDPPYGISIVNAAGTVSTGLPPGPALRGSVGASKPFGKVGTIDRGMQAKPIIEANIYPEIIGDDSTETAIKSYALCSDLKIKSLIFWGGNYYASALPDSSCWIVWDKDNGESFFADAEIAWTNHKTAVRIFKHQWNGLIKASERGERRCHPTQKPVALAVWCYENYGKDAKTILDLFGGSGSALIAAESTGRQCFVMEMAPAYVDVICRRFEAFANTPALLNGKTFSEVAAERLNEQPAKA